MKMQKSSKTEMSITNSEKFFRLGHRDIFRRLYAFECILKHLEEAGKDRRKKERLRSKVAARTIESFLKLGEHEYDQRGYSRFVSE